MNIFEIVYLLIVSWTQQNTYISLESISRWNIYYGKYFQAIINIKTSFVNTRDQANKLQLPRWISITKESQCQIRQNPSISDTPPPPHPHIYTLVLLTYTCVICYATICEKCDLKCVFIIPISQVKHAATREIRKLQYI